LNLLIPLKIRAEKLFEVCGRRYGGFAELNGPVIVADQMQLHLAQGGCAHV